MIPVGLVILTVFFGKAYLLKTPAPTKPDYFVRRGEILSDLNETYAQVVGYRLTSFQETAVSQSAVSFFIIKKFLE